MTSSAPTRVIHRRLLVGTAAHNSHVQHMVRALYERDALYAYFSSGVDVWPGSTLRRVRSWVSASMPPLDRQLARRAVTGVPDDLIRARWRWELPRALAGRFSAAAEVEDWLWERGEHDLDRVCASVVRCPEVGGFVGVEHGALHAIETARACGKPAIVAFLSPHRVVRQRWVDREFERRAELSQGRRPLEERSDRRDARRDDEARLADVVVSGSSFTTRSLVEAGVTPSKILTVPLGGPDPVPLSMLPATPPVTARVVFVGPVSVRKGAHYLLEAWRHVAARNAELHFYGRVLLPDELIATAKAGPGGDRIVFHGSVPGSTLGAVYLTASLLVLPTLCDGFGQVVSDALAYGVPVLTTQNAGAADRVAPGSTGFVVPPADATALADRLVWCVSHPAELFAMRPQALAQAASWTWADFRRTFATDLFEALDRWSAVGTLGALA